MQIVNGWLKEATEIDYGNKSMSRNGWAPKIVVIHGTAGGNSAHDTAAWFRDSDAESSSHIIIDRSGEIVQGISFLVAAWGNGPTTAGHASFLPDSNVVNGNWYTISIELEKPHDDNSDDITPAQKASLYALVDTICRTYGIPRKIATSMDGGILGHKDFDPINRSRCPGTFDWNGLINYLKNGGNMAVPNGWTDKNGTITAPNKHTVTLGFAQWIRDHDWDANNQPLEEAQAADPVEESYNQTPNNGTRQLFAYKELGWTSKRNVYEISVGNELKFVRSDRDKYKAQAKSLDSQVKALQAQVDQLKASQPTPTNDPEKTSMKTALHDIFTKTAQFEPKQ